VSAVPAPHEAARLRALFANNPVVDDVEGRLRAAGVADAGEALAALGSLTAMDVVGLGELTDRERRAVLARFTPAPASRCTCRRPIVYVTDGPAPGRWRHVEGALPHPAVPDYEVDDPPGGGS
jgi:hypothetical protein